MPLLSITQGHPGCRRWSVLPREKSGYTSNNKIMSCNSLSSRRGCVPAILTRSQRYYGFGVSACIFLDISTQQGDVVSTTYDCLSSSELHKEPGTHFYSLDDCGVSCWSRTTNHATRGESINHFLHGITSVSPDYKTTEERKQNINKKKTKTNLPKVDLLWTVRKIW